MERVPGEPRATYVLDTKKNHRFSKEALNAMPKFASTFECGPKAKHYGFTSWDDFFTRRFRSGVRPVATDPKTVTSAAESVPCDPLRPVKGAGPPTGPRERPRAGFGFLRNRP
ncbi:phosphatidylserine decarboxylase [Streptomyces zagrosensis]|uniref:Uncharacterized protein n=1 Tax=Streptomyces zagrosensis TaxID=1042984 RepID=A0A7W9QAB3_9ACTN|nr:phosphatidylserine decarboxylase [Streptomyces zagrosensis]MBB5936515.1 hypothetical protein [Streptomyces zagrosensis]